MVNLLTTNNRALLRYRQIKAARRIYTLESSGIIGCNNDLVPIWHPTIIQPNNNVSLIGLTATYYREMGDIINKSIIPSQ